MRLTNSGALLRCALHSLPLVIIVPCPRPDRYAREATTSTMLDAYRRRLVQTFGMVMVAYSVALLTVDRCCYSCDHDDDFSVLGCPACPNGYPCTFPCSGPC